MKNILVCSLAFASVCLTSCGGGSASSSSESSAGAAPVSWNIYEHLAVSALAVSTAVDPVVEYDFDNNGKDRVEDLSGNNRDADFEEYDDNTERGALTVGGYRGEALLFSEHGRLVVQDKKDLVKDAVTGDLTISLWFSQSEISYLGNVRLVSKKTEWDDNEGFEIEISAENQRIRILTQRFEYIQAINVPIDYEWHHLVARIDGTSGSIFIDGVDKTDPAKSTLANSGILANDLPLTIGNHVSKDVPFQGSIDSFRLFDQAISDADIQSLYADEAKGESLLAHWTFDDVTSDGTGEDTAEDQSINNLDATTYDVLSYAGPAGLGNGIILNGTTSYVACGGKKALAITGQCTINAWVKIDDNTVDRYMRILSKKKEYEKDTGFELEYNPVRQRLSFTGSGDKVARANNIDLGLGAWHMVSAVVNGARVKFYIDGVVVVEYHDEAGGVVLDGLDNAVTSGEINPILQKETEVVLGSSALEKKKDKPKALLIGGLDDVRIYDYPLTVDEIIALIPAPTVTN